MGGWVCVCVLEGESPVTLTRSQTHLVAEMSLFITAGRNGGLHGQSARKEQSGRRDGGAGGQR